MDVDTSRSVGIDHLAAEKRKPHAAAMTMGLRATTLAIPTIDGRCPEPTRSARTKNIGVKKPSWNTRIGTTADASFRTYTAIGIPI